MTVEEAFAKIRLVGVDKETIYSCYVTENRKLVGVVSARSLMIADPQAIVGDLMHENVISVKTTDDKEFVAGQIKKYGYLAIPVVDAEEKIVGIVTIDDAIDVIEEEANEDIQIMTAITPDERPYLPVIITNTVSSLLLAIPLLRKSLTIVFLIAPFENMERTIRKRPYFI
jgi:magnesium transporter